MKRSTIVILIVSLCLIFGGLLLACGAWAVADGNIGLTLYWEGEELRALTPDSAQTSLQTRQVELPAVSSIDLQAAMADLVLQPGEGYSLSYSWRAPFAPEPVWSVENGRLTFRQSNAILSYFPLVQFASSGQSPVIVLTYPSDAVFETVTLSSDSGRVDLSGLAVEQTLQIDADFGNIALSQIKAGDVSICTDSGNCTAENLAAHAVTYDGDFGSGQFSALQAEQFSANSDSGNIRVSDSLLGEARFTVDFGKLELTDTRADNLLADSQSGDMRLQGEYTGDIRLSSDFGSILFQTSLPKEQYSYVTDIEFGSLTVDGKRDAPAYYESALAPHHVDVQAESGSVQLVFGQ